MSFNLEAYGPYLDKIRKLFVPSLEHRIHSLLEEFVYSENSRWAVQFPYFKKFVDAIITWRDPLIKAAEYDIGTMEKEIRSAVKHIVKDDLITCFLNSITLYCRLNKICRELDALGIEDTLPIPNAWDFVNEKQYRRDYFTNSQIAMNYNANSSDTTMSLCDAKGPARCERTIESTMHDICREKSIGHPTTSKRQSHQPIVDASQDFHRRRTENDCTHNVTASQNDVQPINEESCDIKPAKIRSFGKRLRMIVRKMYPEDRGCPTRSKSIVACLALPCKPRDLIGRIFEADPSLTESCFIVMKRKFLISVYNVSSCLNDILDKLDVKFAKTLYLNCEIYPGYIRFRLKNDNVDKCLFVARISICQNFRRRAIQRICMNSICKFKLSTNARELKCSERCDDDDDTRCSRSDRDVKDMAMNMSRNETGNENEEANATRAITECAPKCLQDITISCINSRENTVEEICDVKSQIDNSEEKNRNNRKIAEIDRENDAEKRRRKMIDSNNSIAMTYEELTRSKETKREMGNTFSDKDPDGFSQRDRTRSPDEESNLEDEDCNANTCSIASFVQNSERDKQLVELNFNRFLDNDVGAIDERSKDDSLNSAKVEIGRDSNRFSSRRDDFTDTTVIDNILDVSRAFEASRSYLVATKTRNVNCCKSTKISSKNNDLLTISVQNPRLRVSSKGISASVSYPTVIRSATDDDGSAFIKTRDPLALIVPRRGRAIFRDERVSDKTRDLIEPSRRSAISKYGLRSNISTDLYTTSNTSDSIRCCRSTSKFTASDKRDKFEKSHKFARLSKFCVSSSTGCRNVTSFTTFKYGTASRKDDNYFAKIGPQTMLVMTKFRDSVDRSVGKIKRLFCEKLRKILFNDEIKTMNSSRIFWENENFSEDVTRGKESGRCFRQDYSITSCSTCNCTCNCKNGCTLSSDESSDVILSIRRNRCKEGRKDGMKFHDRRLIDGSEVLSTFRSIETCYDSLRIPTIEDLEKYKKSNRNDRCNGGERKIDRNIVRRQNFCDFRNSKTNITISSQSAKVYGNDLKYLERYTCEQREETRGEKCVYESTCNPNRWKMTRRGYEQRERMRKKIPIKCSNDESFETSSCVRRGRVRNVHKQIQSDISKRKNARGFASLNKNRQKDTYRFDHNRPCKERVFGILTDYADDLDLDFKLHLLRYVELCRNVKRALIKTLRLDFNDFNEVDAMLSSRSRSREEFD